MDPRVRMLRKLMLKEPHGVVVSMMMVTMVWVILIDVAIIIPTPTEGFGLHRFTGVVTTITTITTVMMMMTMMTMRNTVVVPRCHLPRSIMVE